MGVFDGITVLEFGQFVAIPYAGQMFADGGARVIKIEPPEGEPSRHLAPLAPHESRHFIMRNRGKHTLPLDLRHAGAPPVIDRLVARADVVLTNFRPGLAAELGLGAVLLKDESDRLGLPAFKVLGAAWAVERRALREHDVHTLVAASAGNHGRAVAHVAAQRGLHCRIMLPARATPARREAIEAEGADVEIVDGTYEDACLRATRYAEYPYVVELADVGSTSSAHWVIDGYATLFDEAHAQAAYDLVLVPVLAGSGIQ